MRCPKCGAGKIVARITVVLEVPLLRGGGIDLTGVRVTKERLRKEAARSQSAGKNWISCSYCGREFSYTKGEGLSLEGEHLPVPKEHATSEAAAYAPGVQYIITGK